MRASGICDHTLNVLIRSVLYVSMRKSYRMMLSFEDLARLALAGSVTRRR
jgi:hypothetical protein